MSKPILVIGNKNYSSWSLRGWLALRMAGVDFDEVLVPLDLGDWKEQILSYSDAGKVPVLIERDTTVWESLAIIEYIADTRPGAGVWPANRRARARARSIASEMHAGFMALRDSMPMNIRKPRPGKGMTEGTAKDIARICEIWRQCRAEFGGQGPFLFGAFCGADAMYAPVVSRFATHGVELDDTCAAYRDAILGLPAMREWSAAGQAEPWIIAADEID